MNLFLHNIKGWFYSQKHLFFLFGFLSLVPNCVLFVTDPQPLFIGIASILLPLSIIFLLLLLTKKPGIIMWCLLPKIILDGGQLVLLYLFGESVIAVDMFLNLTSSNASEASELLGNIFIVILCVFFLYTLPTLVLAFYSVKIKDTLSSAFRKKWSLYSLFILSGGLICCLLASMQGQKCIVKNDIYPVNALYNLYFAISKSERNANYTKTSADFKFHSLRTDSAKEREIYMVVVGETSRAMEWSLYGYERETTPRLKNIDGLVHFTDVITQSNNTHKSVPIILSAASAENYNVIYNEKSIVSAFKEAGFQTLVIANQKLNTSMIWSFYNEADKFIDMSEFQTESILASFHDGEILPYLKKEIDSTDKNMFIVLHTYGSHFNYHERYPKEFKKFLPDKAEGIRATYKEQLKNSYDNSICYTDYVLSKIIELLDSTKACSSMLYLSDHGEDIFDDTRNRYLHASPIPTYYQLHIPMVIWFSGKYKEEFPQKYYNAFQNMHKPISTNSVFHTMLNLANVKTDNSDSTIAITSSDFLSKDRMYLGDHDDPIPFWKLGLKKQDFEMLNKWNISYDHKSE